MIDGEIVPEEKAKISVMDHGFLFGNSIYEVIRTKNGKLWAVRHHLDRLHYSAQQIAFSLPWPDDLLIEELERMVAEVGLPECSLRLMITRGVGPLSLDPDACKNPVRLIFGKELSRPSEEMYNKGVPLIVSGIRKGGKGHEKGNPKTGNYLDNALALRQANEAGAHEALLLNQAGMVTECTTSNIFWIKDQRLMTPALTAGILKGMSRQIVLKLAEQLGIQILEGLFTLETLMEASEVFITSTSRQILPVSRIDNQAFEVGPLTRELMTRYENFDVDTIKF
jgi:branched-chain amino acid aminotransferase